MSKLHYSINKLILNGNTIFSYGMIFHENKEIKKIELKICYSGKEQYIYTDYGKYRDDISDAFKKFAFSKYSGYIVYGVLEDECNPTSIDFICTYHDNSKESLLTPKDQCTFVRNIRNKKEPNLFHLFKYHLCLLKKAFKLIKSGKISLLLTKIKNYKKHSLGRVKASPKKIIETLTHTERNNAIFIIDHNLGGGANKYRNILAQKKLHMGYSIFILTFNVLSLGYELLVKTFRGEFNYKISNIEDTLLLMNYVNVNEIYYNNAVSFVNPLEIPEFLLSLKHKTNAKLITLAHDFFPVCPSHFLLNSAGEYCGIPNDSSICKKCIKNNKFSFGSLYNSTNIITWRECWGELLNSSDKFIAFSNNTVELYKKAYPKLKKENISVISHNVDYLAKSPKLPTGEDIVIGVVGQIGYHKGSEIVKKLAEEIKKQNVNVSIVVIGTIELQCNNNILVQTEPYTHENLPELLQQYAVSVILFPSICPETFSYVVQEMIEFGYPIASFNLGAPAERLKNYPSGLILSSMEPQSILKELIMLHRKKYYAQRRL